DTEFNYDTIVSRGADKNIHLFSWIKALDGMTTSSIGFDQIATMHIQLIQQIQKDLSLLTHKADIMKINSDINKIFMTDVFPSISGQNENVDQSIFDESFHDAPSDDTIDNGDAQEPNVDKQEIERAKFHAQQVSYFSIQSLTSLLIVLIKSAEKNDPTFVEELLTLAIQLCDQIPMNSFKSSELSPVIDNHWFKSLQPLTNYINELSLSKNVMMANKAMKILLSFSIAKASFKDILSILRKFIFNKVHVYNVRRLFIRLNHVFIKALNKMEKKKQQQQNNDPDNKFEQDTHDDITLNETIGKSMILSELFYIYLLIYCMMSTTGFLHFETAISAIPTGLKREKR
ncbi:unnamed protein product, partial [Rotaria sp. Silwood2]